MKKLIIIYLLFGSIRTEAQIVSFDAVRKSIEMKEYRECLRLLEINFKNTVALTSYHYYYRSLCEFYSNNLDTAVYYADIGINLIPEHDTLISELLYLKAYSYYELNNYASALKTLNEGLKISPETVNFYFLKGEILSNQGDLLSTLETFKIALSEVSDSRHVIYNNLSYFSLETGDFQAAIQYADSGLSLTFDTIWTGSLLNNKGLAIGLSIDYQLGIDMIKKSLNYYSQNSYAYFNLGILYLNKENKELACSNFIRAKELGAVNMTRKIIQEYCE